MGVKLAAASGGSIELVPINTASNFTVTVPAVTGTMLTTATAGTVLQVVQGSTTTPTTTTSTTPVTTTLTASITPTLSTSKVFVLINFGQVGANATSAGLSFYMYRNGSSLGQLSQNTLYNNGSGFSLTLATASFQYLDSPATTSSTTYAVFFAQPSGASIVCQRDSIISYITLMEIAA